MPTDSEILTDLEREARTVVGRFMADKIRDECIATLRKYAAIARACEAGTHKVVPVEPSAEMIAAACIAAHPPATLADIELATAAAKIAVMQMDLAPGCTVADVALSVATMAPSFRVLIAAAPQFQEEGK